MTSQNSVLSQNMDISLVSAVSASCLSTPTPTEEETRVNSEGSHQLHPQSDNRVSAQMRNFYIISLSYICFTLTDGALRLIVLMQANDLGFSAFQISLMFVLYELFGVLTNFLGGLLGSKMGLKSTLIVGLALQIVSCVMLMPFTNTERWHELGTQNSQIVYIMFAQSLAGVSKDLVKVSGKSVSKLVTKEGDDQRLFKLVARITGLKNETKGLGFFFGTLLQKTAGFLTALLVLVGIILVIFVPALLWLDGSVGRSAKKIVWSKVFKKPKDFNLLCLARFFLFGSRDIWFEVVLPVYMKNILGWDSLVVGCFLASWTILYGIIQTHTKEIALKPLKQFPPEKHHAWSWAGWLTVLGVAVAAAMTGVNAAYSNDAAVAVIVTGLGLYAVLFAINSSAHSYLVVKLSDHDKVAMDVGFYYMANAGGRLVGTLLGGVLYSFFQEGSSQVVLTPSGNYTVSAQFDVTARTASFTATLWFAAVFAGITTILSIVLGKTGEVSQIDSTEGE